MAKVLKDPIAPKKRENGEKNWSFTAPTKDHSHSGCIRAGNDYGMAFRVPVGTVKDSGMDAGPIPQQSRRFSVDEIFYGEDKKG